jgi:hypothetical protein
MVFLLANRKGSTEEMAIWGRVWSTLVRGDEAQETLEYVIVTGVIVVLMMAALFLGMPGIIRLGASAMCPTVDPVGFAMPTPCIVP